MKKTNSHTQVLADGTRVLNYTLTGRPLEWQSVREQLSAEKSDNVSTHFRIVHTRGKTTVTVTVTDESVPYAEWWSGC